MKLFQETSIIGLLNVSLVGEFDALGTKQIRSEFEKICEAKEISTVIVDLKGVNFLDSSGVGALVFLFKRLIADERKMKLIGLSGQPAELMHLLRVDEAIPIEWDDDVDEQVLRVAQK